MPSAAVLQNAISVSVGIQNAYCAGAADKTHPSHSAVDARNAGLAVSARGSELALAASKDHPTAPAALGPSVTDDPFQDAFWTTQVIHPDLEIRPHSNRAKGLCVIASEAIQAGSLLFREPPMLTLPSWAFSRKGLRSRWEALDLTSQIKFWHLAAGGFHPHAMSAKDLASGSFPVTAEMQAEIKRVPVSPANANSGSYQYGRSQSSNAPNLLHPWAPLLGLALASKKPSVLRVFATNAIALPVAGCDGTAFDSWIEGGAGIFELISRVNHSCVPNAGFWFRHDDRGADPVAAPDLGVCDTGFQPDQDEIRGVMELRATRDLAKGEEVFITYIDPYQSRDLRQEALLPYGFICACPACDPHGTDPLPPAVGRPEPGASMSARLAPTAAERLEFFESSVKRRARMEEIDSSLPSSGRFLVEGSRSHVGQSRLKTAIEMVGLLRQESLLGARIARVYLDVACLAEYHGDIERAHKAATRALPHYRASVGLNDRYYLTAEKMVDRLYHCLSSLDTEKKCKDSFQEETHSSYTAKTLDVEVIG